jgi:large subunit ribosomal protein L25
MPVNIYGASKPNITVAVDSSDFYKALEDHHQLFQIDFDGNSETGILKEVQYDTFGDHTIHADLSRVGTNDIVETTMSILTLGIPKGVSSGATLDVAYHHVPVRGKVGKLKNSLTLKIDHLESNESIRAKDLEIPTGVELLLAEGTPIVIVHARKGS